MHFIFKRISVVQCKELLAFSVVVAAFLREVYSREAKIGHCSAGSARL